MSIESLVAKYERNHDHNISPKYNESQLRTDFLDPLFKLLGWDISNSEGKATHEREVIVEEPLKENANSNTKKPDYTFRLFAQRKFFVEAKKPAVNIQSDDSPAKQVRRYGFTAKLKISVLSNFEYLAIYDCSKPVKDEDLASNSRIVIYHYTEFVEKFDEIKRQLGQDEVYSGRFDKTWEHIEKELKLQSVDTLFLAQINKWRLLLARELYAIDSGISQDDLNDIVQSYLNSLIFLRVCEDRNLEDFETLLSFANDEDITSLIEKFKDSDAIYNAGLFSHRYTDEVISNNGDAFWRIIKQLYFPESPYSFSVFASDILGRIYEVFLSEHIVIKRDDIHLCKKPENEDRDVVTTPTFIIHDILRQTLLEYVEDKSAEEILGIKVADIACGSGAFLLESYQFLHDVLVDKFLETDPDKLIQTSVGTYKLDYATKKAILESCIHGVDKDFSAVEACKFGLLLKLLEDESSAALPHPVLPNIDTSIQYGNSLISSEHVNTGEEEINPYDFEDDKFDVIVGNPPYMATEHMGLYTPKEISKYKDLYESAHKQFDKYFLFIERGLSLLKDDGKLGYIVPSKFYKVGAGIKLRALLKSQKSLSKLVSFGANQVFEGKTTYTCLLLLCKSESDNVDYLEVSDLEHWKTRIISDDNFESLFVDELEDELWIMLDKERKGIYDSIRSNSKRLGELVGDDGVYNGIQTSANGVYIHSVNRVENGLVYFTKNNKDWCVEEKLTRPYFKTQGANSINTYKPFSANAFVIYPYINDGTSLKFVTIDVLRTDYPKTYAYLLDNKACLEKRNILPEPKTNDEWYRFGRHQCLEKCDVPEKIIVGVLSAGGKYAIDYGGTLIASGGTAGYCMITLPDDSKYSVYYIQALLNSKYLEWFVSLHGEVFRGGYVARGTKVLKQLPIVTIDFENNVQNELHDNIVKLQKSLISTYTQMEEDKESKRKWTPLNRSFAKKQEEMRGLLKKLFNLGDSDKKIPLIFEIYNEAN
jgi:type I restriction-modification system DNA methylase subunit